MFTKFRIGESAVCHCGYIAHDGGTLPAGPSDYQNLRAETWPADTPEREISHIMNHTLNNNNNLDISLAQGASPITTTVHDTMVNRPKTKN